MLFPKPQVCGKSETTQYSQSSEHSPRQRTSLHVGGYATVVKNTNRRKGREGRSAMVG